MKHTFNILLFLVIFGCNNQQPTQTEKATVSDSIPYVKDTLQSKTIDAENDTVFLALTKEILTVIKTKDYQQLGSFIHPGTGVRFSPYGYIDTAKDKTFNAGELLDKIKRKEKINWGNYDGSGEKIFLTVEQYFKEFVYNADFVNAPQISVNKMVGTGNSLNNLETIYRDADFTESHFPGFDKKYDGMDWSSVRLVFKKIENKIYLIGIVHDQWTS